MVWQSSSSHGDTIHTQCTQRKNPNPNKLRLQARVLDGEVIVVPPVDFGNVAQLLRIVVCGALDLPSRRTELYIEQLTHRDRRQRAPRRPTEETQPNLRFGEEGIYLPEQRGDRRVNRVEGQNKGLRWK